MNQHANELLQNGICGLTDHSSPGDWRLPTEEEVKSILKPSCSTANGGTNPYALFDATGMGCDNNTGLWLFGGFQWAIPTATIDPNDYSKFILMNKWKGVSSNWGRDQPSMAFWAVRSAKV